MSEPFPVCPTCGGYIPNNDTPGAYPGALSRKDNLTEICSACGTAEAMAGIPRDYSIGIYEPTEVSAGWHLPAGDNVQPQPVLVPHAINRLAAMIGGGCKYIEAIQGGTINMDTGEVTYLIGFVDEDGFAHQQTPNYLAMALFQNNQIIVGDCYVVGAVNPETLEADGEPYDIPDEVPIGVIKSCRAPSYKAIAIAILSNDHNLHQLGFMRSETQNSRLLYQQRKSSERSQLSIF